MKRLAALLVTVLAAAGLVAFIVLMASLVYPGAMKWTAGTVCPEDKPDTVVVRDTYQTQPGETSTNFTMYCIGPRGETEDVGFGEPVGVLILWATAVTTAVIVGLFLIGALRRLLSGSDNDTGDMAPGSLGEVDPVATDFGGQPPLIV